MNTIVAVLLFVAGILSLTKANDYYPHGSIGVYGNIVFSLTLGALAVASLPFTGQRLTELYRTDYRIIILLFVFGAAFFIGNSFFFQGLTQAPNPGYTRALMTLEVVLLTVISALLFGKPISWQKAIGVLITVVGVVVVSLD